MKKNSKKTDNNKTGLIALALVLVVALVAGGTYAYWRWNSNNVVAVNLTTDIGTMGLTLNGGTVTINRLAPAPCTHGDFATKVTTTVSRYNTTAYPGYVTLRLSLTSLKFSQGTLTSADLSHIHFLVSTSSTSCATAVNGSIPESTSAGTAISGTLSGATIGTVGTAKTQTTTLVDWIYKLPIGNAATAGTPSQQKTDTYYLYVWLDTGYEFTNYGSNAIQDPMQNLEFTLQWSVVGQIEQHVS